MIGNRYFDHQLRISKFLSNSILTANMAENLFSNTILSVFRQIIMTIFIISLKSHFI
jgi:hypothetical protein